MRIQRHYLAGIFSAIALAPSMALGQATGQGDSYGYGPRMMGWDGGWYMFFGPLFMILTLAVVIAFVVLLVRWLGGGQFGPPPPPPAGRTPLDILKERFARGEINKDEFEERRRVLGD